MNRETINIYKNDVQYEVLKVHQCKYIKDCDTWKDSKLLTLLYPCWINSSMLKQRVYNNLEQTSFCNLHTEAT